MSIRQSIIFCGVGILFFAFFLSVSLHAQDGMSEYEVQWVKRNAQSRLEIITRAVSHYRKALHYFNNGKLKEAELWVSDALKVESRFPEALELKALIYQRQGDEERESEYAEKSDVTRRSLFMPVLKERQYLEANIDRLRSMYVPPRGFQRVMFFLLSCAIIFIVLLILSATESFLLFSMSLRKVLHLSRKGEEDVTNVSSILVSPFPSDKKEEKESRWGHVIIYGFCFLLCFGVVYLIGPETKKEFYSFAIGGGFVLSFFMYIMVLADHDVDLPPGRNGGNR
jgi:hypothetical protein